MRRAAFTCSVYLVLPALVSAQELVFRAAARTVSIYATVRDRDGRLVPGLTRSDFQVFDDGRPAEITTFSNDVLPASIALMLDMSTSMIAEQLRVRDAALHFVDALLPADRVRIGTFGEEIALSPWLTSDKAILGRIIREEVWPGGETPLWSAMWAAMTSLSDATSRRVLVTLSDGIDTGCAAITSQSRCATLADVEKTVIESEFMVYAIGMEGPGLTGGLVRLADETGGGHFELKRNVDLTKTFTEVADELHHQYALGVTPVALDGRVHTLEVRVAGSGLTARARKSYLAVEK